MDAIESGIGHISNCLQPPEPEEPFHTGDSNPLRVSVNKKVKILRRMQHPRRRKSSRKLPTLHQRGSERRDSFRSHHGAARRAISPTHSAVTAPAKTSIV